MPQGEMRTLGLAGALYLPSCVTSGTLGYLPKLQFLSSVNRELSSSRIWYFYAILNCV